MEFLICRVERAVRRGNAAFIQGHPADCAARCRHAASRVNREAAIRRSHRAAVIHAERIIRRGNAAFVHGHSADNALAFRRDAAVVQGHAVDGILIRIVPFDCRIIEGAEVCRHFVQISAAVGLYRARGERACCRDVAAAIYVELIACRAERAGFAVHNKVIVRRDNAAASHRHAADDAGLCGPTAGEGPARCRYIAVRVGLEAAVPILDGRGGHIAVRHPYITDVAFLCRHLTGFIHGELAARRGDRPVFQVDVPDVAFLRGDLVHVGHVPVSHPDAAHVALRCGDLSGLIHGELAACRGDHPVLQVDVPDVAFLRGDLVHVGHVPVSHPDAADVAFFRRHLASLDSVPFDRGLSVRRFKNSAVFGHLHAARAGSDRRRSVGHAHVGRIGLEVRSGFIQIDAGVFIFRVKIAFFIDGEFVIRRAQRTVNIRIARGRDVSIIVHAEARVVAVTADPEAFFRQGVPRAVAGLVLLLDKKAFFIVHRAGPVIRFAGFFRIGRRFFVSAGRGKLHRVFRRRIGLAVLAAAACQPPQFVFLLRARRGRRREESRRPAPRDGAFFRIMDRHCISSFGYNDSDSFFDSK